MGTTMKDCGPVTRDLIARLMSPTRNRYYYGKLLDAYHLELEQDYGNSKRWLLNRLSLGAGVLCGLGVRISTDKKRVRVLSGVAIDFWGREIIVPQDSQPFDPAQPTDDCGRPSGDSIRQGVVTLYLCYHECEAEPAPAMVDECGASACENGLVRERYRLRVSAGTPRPPGVITEEQCKRIDEEPPQGVTRRTVVCQTLGGPCAVPDESCVPIATIELRDGIIGSIDTCTFRPNVYSNTVLLDLILCLAERVDDCCGPVTATKAIAVRSGDNQAGPAGQPLPKPLIARVTLAGAAVPNEAVTFEVVAGSGAIGASTSSLGATFTTNTDGNGDATLPVWQLGPTAGSGQQVKASITSGPSVVFNAKAEDIPVADPPVVRVIWPPNGAQLGPNASPQGQQWFRRFIESPELQLTFDRQMRTSHLQAPEKWLRLFALLARDRVAEANASIVAIPIALRYAGPTNTPILGVSGVTERFRAEVPRELFRQITRFLVQIDAQGGTITEANPPGLLLDAEFAGTKLVLAQLDKLWPITAPTPSDLATFNALTDGGATLPESGDGVPGGRFHSWFEVLP